MKALVGKPPHRDRMIVLIEKLLCPGVYEEERSALQC